MPDDEKKKKKKDAVVKNDKPKSSSIKSNVKPNLKPLTAALAKADVNKANNTNSTSTVA